MRLRLANVEYRVCPECSGTHVGPHAGYYEGGQCICRSSFNDQTTRKTTEKRLILVDAEPPIYESESRYACGNCGNLYETPPCPLCDCEDVPRDKKTVWVRTFHRVESFEEMQSRELLGSDEGDPWKMIPDDGFEEEVDDDE